ncbi:unnamed protein product, partial [Rotaria magnacalcarata]
MIHFKHDNLKPTNFTTILTTKFRSTCGYCFRSKPTIVGYTPIDPDNNQTRRQTFSNHTSANHYSSTDELQKLGL